MRKPAIYMVSVLLAVSAFGQNRPQWRTSADIADGIRGSAIGTVTDTEEGRVRFTMVLDDDPSSSVTVETDSVATQYNGFGGTINGSPEIFTGSTGFSNLRTGDRVNVIGTGRGRGLLSADTVTLLGRSVAAAQTGVGQTRTPTSISPPTSRGTTPTTSPDSVGRLEGTVRQINVDEGRFVIETGARQMLTIRASSSTPVYYRGDVYRISNLEVGDHVRIDPETGATGSGEVRARVIDVLQSVQETQGGNTRQFGNLSGRVTRVDRTANVIRIDNGRGGEVRVDLSAAADSQGRRVTAKDIQAGDRLDLTGNYSGDVFIASTVRFADDVFANRGAAGAATPGEPSLPADLGVVTIYATVSQSLSAAPQLVLRDTQNNRTVRVYLTDDFVIKSRMGSYTTADHLKEGDSVVVKAYRDADGNYIAQTIRQR